MRTFFITAFLLIKTQLLFAQNIFTKEFQSLDSNFFITNMIETSDHGFAICGSNSVDIDVRGDDSYIAKFDSNYNNLWSITIGEDVSDEVFSNVIEMSDKGFLVAGYKQTNSNTVINDFWTLYRLDKNGNLAWARQWGVEYFQPYSVKLLQINDTTIIIMAYTSHGSISEYEAVLMNINLEGTVRWSKLLYGNPSAIIKNDDTSFVILEESELRTPTHSIDILKINTSGNIVWCKHLANDDGLYRGYDIVKANQGYILTGQVHASNTSKTDMLIAKISKEGNFIWSKAVGTELNDYGYNLIKTKDEYYSILGFSSEGNNSLGYLNLIRFNENGDILRTNSKSNMSNYFSSISHLQDASYLIFMFSGSWTQRNQYLLKTDKSETLCESTTLLFKEKVLSLDFSDTTKSFLNLTLINGPNADSIIPIITTLLNVCSSVLPLQLLSFSANHNGKANLLKWSTAEEINTDKFEIQRSSNSRDFVSIGNVRTLNNGKTKNDYVFTDAQPLKTVNYYRLKLLDKDGKFTYSAIKNVNNSSSFDLVVYPNPVHQNLTLNFNTEKAMDVQLEIVNAEGKKVYTNKMQLVYGSSLQYINIATFAAGNYFVKCITADGQMGLKFVKQ